MFRSQVGIIGGSGFYELEGLESKQLVSATTEFGAPSDELVTGRIGGVQCVVLARYGPTYSTTHACTCAFTVQYFDGSAGDINSNSSCNNDGNSDNKKKKNQE